MAAIHLKTKILLIFNVITGQYLHDNSFYKNYGSTIVKTRE